MDDQERILNAVIDVKETIAVLIAGLRQMLQAQAATQAISKEILKAVTAEPEGDSPLAEALAHILRTVEANNRMLGSMVATLNKHG